MDCRFVSVVINEEQGFLGSENTVQPFDTWIGRWAN
jgi:hypothetical protein